MGNSSDADKQRELLRHVPKDGTAIANSQLIADLGWKDDTYRRVRDQLCVSGALQLWRGRGGTVRRAVGVAGLDGGVRSQRPGVTRERDLYPAFLRALTVWASDQGWHHFLVRQTAHAGRRSTGGVWTRPDFAVLGVRRFRFTPGVVRDLITFEVKSADTNALAVFEAAAHSRCATQSWVAVHRDPRPDEELLDRMENECQRLGLGLLLFGDNPSPYKWDYRVDPVRREPDPAALEEFVETQLTDHDHIAGWLAGPPTPDVT